MTDNEILAFQRAKHGDPYMPLSMAKKMQHEEYKWRHVTALAKKGAAGGETPRRRAVPLRRRDMSDAFRWAKHNEVPSAAGSVIRNPQRNGICPAGSGPAASTTGPRSSGSRPCAVPPVASPSTWCPWLAPPRTPHPCRSPTGTRTGQRFLLVADLYE
jgi:hypothetical protein